MIYIICLNQIETVMRIKLISLFILFSVILNAQDKPKSWQLDGYVKNLQTTMVDSLDGTWLGMNTIHNRLNFSWYLHQNLTFTTSVRNNLHYGGLVTVGNVTNEFDLKSMYELDNGFVDMTTILSDGNSYLLQTSVDRFYFDYTQGDFQARVGRQRINWGMGLVWNPNDIFNAFSYFDFDYEERPGSDAIKLEYYLNYTSSVQVVAKMDHDSALTLAGMYRFNKWSYDIQFLGGVMPKDYVAGLGWAGDIKGAGFRGEATYLHPKDNPSDTTGVLIASVDADYTFPKGLYIHGAVLYNSKGAIGDATREGGLFFNQDVSIKTLTPARMSLFAQLGYPISPLVRGDLSAIYNPYDQSFFVGPGATVSIADNWDLLLMAQLLQGEVGTEFGGFGLGMFYVRMKWGF